MIRLWQFFHRLLLHIATQICIITIFNGLYLDKKFTNFDFFFFSKGVFFEIQDLELDGIMLFKFLSYTMYNTTMVTFDYAKIQTKCQIEIEGLITSMKKKKKYEDLYQGL